MQRRRIASPHARPNRRTELNPTAARRRECELRRTSRVGFHADKRGGGCPLAAVVRVALGLETSPSCCYGVS